MKHTYKTTQTTPPYSEHTILVPRTVKGITYKYTLYYKIVRPNFLSSETHAPLVIVHGGLGLPSDYLQPMADQIQEERSVVFYDMLGCGRSESPSSLEYYSIPDAVHDLYLLIQHLHLTHFHLYAHSAGVVIAYEYLILYNKGWQDCTTNSVTTTTTADTTADTTTTDATSTKSSYICLSAIFASGSFHLGLAKQCTDEAQRKIQHELEDNDNDEPFVTNGKEKSPNGDTYDAKRYNLAEEIRKLVICRTDTMPLALKSAYEKSGTVWKGISVIQDYVATCPNDASCIPPILLLRGEFDFMAEDLVFAGWLNVLGECENRIEMITVRNCSHMLMLEDPVSHGQIICDFYNTHDKTL